VAPRVDKVFGNLAEEGVVFLPLEDLAQEVTSPLQEPPGDVQGEPAEGDAPRVVERPVPAQPGGHVADDGVGRPDLPREGFKEGRVSKVRSPDVDPLDRHHAHAVHRHDAAFVAHELSRDLRPSARRGPEVHDGVSLEDQIEPCVRLDQLERGARTIPLLLGGAIELVLLSALEPVLSHEEPDGGFPPKGLPRGEKGGPVAECPFDRSAP